MGIPVLSRQKINKNKPYSYINGSGQKINLLIDENIDYKKSISFEEFVHYVNINPNHKLNQHWRPQYEFLAHPDFRLFNLKQLPNALLAIESLLGIKTVPAPTLNQSRPKALTKKLPQNLHELPAEELRSFRINIDSLYNSELKNTVKKRFSKDFELLTKTQDLNCREL